MCSLCEPSFRPTRRRLLGTAMAAVALPGVPSPRPPVAAVTVEPRLVLADAQADKLTVAVTLDACPGGFDGRIAAALIVQRIKATIFLSGGWIRRNPSALRLFCDHRDLFAFGNHGARHVAPVLGNASLFGVPAAGDLAAIRREVEDGAAAIDAACGTTPVWFRGATARYSPEAIPAIEALGVRIAGFSLNADVGASLPAASVAARIAHARSGDVIIGHANQPERPSGQGIVDGLLHLQRGGARFVWLDEAADSA